MMYSSIIFSILLALIFAFLLSSGFKRRGPGPLNGLVFITLIIFMFSFTFGSWMVPFGPLTWGVSWAAYLLIAILIMFLLGVLLPGPETEKQIIDKDELDKEVKRKRAIKSMDRAAGIFFWILLIAFIIILLFRQFYLV